MNKKEKKGWSPNPYVLIVLIVLLCTIATWIVPAGNFERAYDEELGRELVVFLTASMTLQISFSLFCSQPLTSMFFPKKVH